ncbi:hypothetical protein [Halorussus caseinilyticus]|uniref:hypothetical protein n=1 Tax=Halorussus caseinilyticus TaxID=3034025 RepID=UPI0023E8DDBA|nr:hypothetical protein [Halorussus sp. DT72]
MGSPENVVFFETADGTVAENSLRLLTRPSQRIEITGTGSALASTIQFAQPLNAENTSVSLTGLYTAGEQTKTVSGHNTAETVPIDGNRVPDRQRLRLSGQVASERVATSGTYTGSGSAPTLPVRGNMPPRDVRVDLAANLSENRVTDSETLGLDARPTRAVVSQLTDGETGVVEVRRNGTYEVAVEWKMRNTQYGGMHGRFTVSACDESGCRQLTTVERRFGGGRYRASRSGTYRATVALDAGERLEIEVAESGWGKTKIPAQVVTTYQGERTPATETVTVGGNLPPANASLTLTGNDGVETRYGTPRVNVHGNPEDYGSVSREKTRTLFYARESGYYTLRLPWVVKATTATTYGDEHGGRADLALHVGGETVLSKTAETAPGGRDVDSGTYRERVYLDAGETVRAEMEAADAATVRVSGTDAGVVTTAPTGRVEVTVNGRTYQTSALAPGESETLTLSLHNGTNQIEVETTGGKQVGFDLAYTERTGTRRPVVRVGGETVCSFTGVLDGTRTCDVPQSLLDGESADFEITTASGPVAYDVSYRARAAPTNATVTVNGETYRYPSEFDGRGPLTDGMVSRNVSALALGANTVEVATPEVDGLRPTVTATLQYAGEARQTTKPSVVVESPDGTTHRKAVPEAVLGRDGTLTGTYDVVVPAEWFGRGRNVVRVETADASQVRAVVQSSGLTRQVRTFNTTA